MNRWTRPYTADTASAQGNCGRLVAIALALIVLLTASALADTIGLPPVGLANVSASDTSANANKDAQYTVDTTGRTDFTTSDEGWYVIVPDNMCYWYLAPPNCDSYLQDCEDVDTPTELYWSSFGDTTVLNCDVVLDGYWIDPCSVKISTDFIQSPAASLNWSGTNRLEAQVYNSGNMRVAVQLTANNNYTTSEDWVWAPAGEWTTIWANESPLVPLGNVTQVKVHLACDAAVFDGTVSIDWIAGLNVPTPEPPYLQEPAPGDTIDTNPPTFVWYHVYDADEYRIQYSIDQTFTDASTETRRVTDSSYVPTAELDESTYYWRVQSINAHEFTSNYAAADSFVVVSANQPPQFDTIPDTVKTVEGAPVTFEIFASDPDADPLSLQATGLPDGASFADSGDGAGTFEWTPDFGTSGLYPIVVNVDDGELSVEDTVIVIVAGIVNVTPSQGYPGETLTVTITGDHTEFGQAAYTLVRFERSDSVFADTAAVISRTELTVEIAIPDTAAIGLYEVVVYELPSPGQTVTAPGAFEIVAGSNLSLSADTLFFNATQDSSAPESQELIISSDNEPLSYVADLTGIDWATFAPESGTTPDTIDVTVDITSLTPGTYDATVPITAADALNSPQNLVIELTIDPDSIALIIDSTSLSFIATQDGANPTSKSFTIATDGAAVDFSIAEPGVSWMTLEPTSGTTDTTVTVSIDISGLSAGDYTDTLSISSANPLVTNSPQKVAVTLTLEPPANNIALAPATLDFTATEGSVNPDSKTCQVTSSAEDFDFVATEAATWIDVTPTAATTPATLEVSIDISGLTPGTYNDSIIIASDLADNSPKHLYVTLTVNEDTTPLVTQIVPSQGTQGQSVEATISGVYTSFGQGEQTLVRFQNQSTDFSAIGTALSTTEVTATVNIPASATTGLYDVTVEETGIGEVTLSDAFEVLAGSDLVLSTNLITFSTDLAGDDPAPQILTVSSSTDTPLAFSAGSTASDWVSLDPVAGTTPQTITVGVDTDGLEPGTFEDTIQIVADAALNSPVQVIVRLSVSSGLTCQATADPLSGPTPLEVTFTSSVTGGLPPYTYYWDFDNGYSDTTSSATHTYHIPRAYNAMLFVSDNEGTTCSTAIAITALPNPILALNTSTLSYGDALTSASLSIDNAGTGTLLWEATTVPPWATITPSSGAVTDVLQPVQVTIDRQAMAPGTYVDSLGIASETDTAFVTLLVEVIPATDLLEITPQAIDLGVASSVEQFTLRSLATQPIAWNVYYRPEWIPQITPSGGTMFPEEEVVLTVRAARDGRRAGGYSGEIGIETNAGQYETAAIAMTVPLQIINTGTYGLSVVDTPCVTFNSTVSDDDISDYLQFTGTTQPLQWDRYVDNEGFTEVCFYPSEAEPFDQLREIVISASDSLTDVNGVAYAPASAGPVFVTGALVWPGDGNADGTVDERDILPLGLYFGASGPARDQTDQTWAPHLAMALDDFRRWQPYAAVYADADGSGTIDTADVCALSANWGAASAGSTGDMIARGAGNLGQLDKSRLETLYDAACNCPESPGQKQLKQVLAQQLAIASDVLPTTPRLYQNYPNPFNPRTTIAFYLPKAGHVSLKVYNLLGQEVQTLYDGPCSQGTRTVDFNATDYSGRVVSSGTYFYVLEVDHNTRLTGTMMLLK